MHKVSAASLISKYIDESKIISLKERLYNFFPPFIFFYDKTTERFMLKHSVTVAQVTL